MASLSRKDYIEIFMLASETWRLAPKGKRQGMEIRWRMEKVIAHCETVVGQLPRPGERLHEPVEEPDDK